MSRRIVSMCAGAVLFAFLVSGTSPRRLCQGFLPPNDMKISIGSKQDKGLTRDQYDAVLDRVQQVYGPIIAAQGAELEIARLWEDDTVNAYAQRNGNQYIIAMYGGLARHEVVTQDGFALVACHELGHHLGGAPKKPQRWASNEGQADYYANLKCLRRIFGDSGSASFTRLKAEADPTAQAGCRALWANPQDQALCLRASMAGLSVSTLLGLLRRDEKPPRFDTPDPKTVAQTYHAHPEAQCRLDTYFQGSICTRPVDEALDDANPIPGTCARSRGDEAGLRPRCWFKPPAGENLMESTAFLSLKTQDPWAETR